MRYTSILRAAKPKKNLTGFDIQALAAASGQAKNDPWDRHEAWRYKGEFTRKERFRDLFPGFKVAAVAFAAYCVFEYFFLKEEHHGEEHHGEGHH